MGITKEQLEEILMCDDVDSNNFLTKVCPICGGKIKCIDIDTSYTLSCVNGCFSTDVRGI